MRLCPFASLISMLALPVVTPGRSFGTRARSLGITVGVLTFTGSNSALP